MYSAIRKRQIKTALRFHLTPVRIAKIKETTNKNCWRGCGIEKLKSLEISVDNSQKLKINLYIMYSENAVGILLYGEMEF